MQCKWSKVFLAGVVCLLILAAAGCSANTSQSTDSTQPVATKAESKQATQQPANLIGVLCTVHPEGKKLVKDAHGYEEKQTEEGNVFALNQGAAEPSATGNITYNYNTTFGAVTVSNNSTQAADARNTSTGSATGDQKADAATDQKVDPNVSANLQATNASAGGNASPNATGSAGSSGTTSSEQKTDAAMTAILNEIKAQNDTLAQLVEALKPRAEAKPADTQAAESVDADDADSGVAEETEADEGTDGG